MPKSVIVHGPQACGKTYNAKRIAKHFGLSKIVDDYSHGRIEPTGTLYLTHLLPTQNGGARVVAYSTLPASVRVKP